MNRWKAVIAALAFSASAAVHAASVTITWANPVFNPAGVNVGQISYPGGGVDANAGRFKGVASNLVGVNASEFYLNVNSVFAYCYELTQTLSNGSAINYTIQNGASGSTLDFLGAANAYLAGDDFAWLNPGTSNIAAAIQIGIWKSIYNDQWALGAGSLVSFTALSANVQTIYNAIIALIPSTNALDASRVMTLVSGTRQDVITGRRDRFVPEPGSLALLGVAAALAGFVRRKPR